MSKAGLALFIFGVSFSLTLAANPNINYGLYGFGLVILIASLIIYRKGISSGNEVDQGQQATHPNESLPAMLSRFENIETNLKNGTEVLNEIDAIREELLIPFAQKRDFWANQFGLENFSQFFNSFSISERYLARTWSASADGHSKEAISSIAISIENLKKAQEFANNLKA